GAGADSKLYLVVKVLGGEAPKINAPPKSRSSSSRDGTIVSKGPSSVTSSGKGSLKTRRSMIWGPKSRSPQQSETGKESQRLPPQSSHSTMSQDKKANAPGKEPTVARTVGVGVL